MLFQVASDCYEQKSLIITSNLEFGRLSSAFGDNMPANALVDRLIHHSRIVVCSGTGHRLEESIQRQKRGGASA
ncbi:MAG: ATP-binding protein [Clostridiales bacterium]|nr:ATP-binding protein [Clostridiales bacterium]